MYIYIYCKRRRVVSFALAVGSGCVGAHSGVGLAGGEAPSFNNLETPHLVGGEKVMR